MKLASILVLGLCHGALGAHASRLVTTDKVVVVGPQQRVRARRHVQESDASLLQGSFRRHRVMPPAEGQEMSSALVLVEQSPQDGASFEINQKQAADVVLQVPPREQSLHPMQVLQDVQLQKDPQPSVEDVTQLQSQQRQDQMPQEGQSQLIEGSFQPLQRVDQSQQTDSSVLTVEPVGAKPPQQVRYQLSASQGSPQQPVQEAAAIPPQQEIREPQELQQAGPVSQVQVSQVQAQQAQTVSTWDGCWVAVNMPWLWSLLKTFSFAVIIKFLCMTGNVLVQVSPYPQVKRWESRKNTGEADAAPYVSICYCGWQWCFYGTFAWLVTNRTGFLILVQSNCLGAVLGMYYTFTFYRNCSCDASRASLLRYLQGVAFLVAFQAGGLAVLRLDRALFLSGLVSSFCSFVGACSMLVTVPTVIQTQNSQSIPGGLVGAYFASAIVWCMCGYMLGDMLVMGPNVVAAISSLFCIWLKFQYPSKDGDPALEAMPSAAAIAKKNAALNDALPPAPPALARDSLHDSRVPLPEPEGVCRSSTGGTD